MAEFFQRDDAGFGNDVEMPQQVFDDDIFELVEYIRREHLQKFCTDLDPNLIFMRLEEYQGHPDRAKLAMDALLSHTPPPQRRRVNTEGGDWEMRDAMNDDVHVPSPGTASDSDREFIFANSPVRIILEEGGEASPVRTIPLIDLELMDNTEPSGSTFVDVIKEPEIDSKEKILIALLECFPDAELKYLRALVSRVKNSLELNSEVEKWLIPGNYPKQIQQVNSEPDVKPSTSHGQRSTTRDETIYNEDTFNRLFDEFKEFVKEKEKKRAKPNDFFPPVQNDYGTCQCCFEDKVKFEESEFCADGNHQFCRTCVRKLAEGAVAQNVNALKCMAADCPSTFSDEAAKRVLKPIVYERWTQRCQLKEVKMANLPNFKTCPHCNYGAIVDNLGEKLFHCLNSECKKVTCLFCRGENHIPLKCDEVKKPKEVASRTSREERLASALIRSCPKCNLQFIKEDGCNVMKCACGQLMCFVCRQPIQNYDHFRNSRCCLDTFGLVLEAITPAVYEAKEPKRERLTDDASSDEMSGDDNLEIEDGDDNQKILDDEVDREIEDGKDDEDKWIPTEIKTEALNADKSS